MQQALKAGLSVVIITFNEANNIGRCIESVKALADEIVVVDSVSTDGTQAICHSYNARVIEQPFLGYIEQKNFAFGLAEYDYILSLDADELLSEPLARQLLEEKRKGFRYEAYRFNRLSNYCGQWIRHGTWYPDRKIRLVKNGVYSWGGENPHDELMGSAKSSVCTISKDILHYSYVNFSDHITQNNKFSSIAAAAMHRQHKKANMFEIMIRPAWAFFLCYIIRRGFLDGKNGFIIAKMVGMQTFLKYTKLAALNAAVE